MNSFKLPYINSIIVCFSSLFLFGQTPEKLKEYKNKFPGNNYVMTKHNVKVSIDIEKGIPVIHTNTHDEFLILNQIGVTAMVEDEIQFSSFETIEEIEAYSIIPNGKDGKKIKVTEFVTKGAEKEGYVFHDDMKKTTFLYPSLCEGALRVLDYTQKTLENRFPFGFNFSSYLPVDNASFTIDCDSSIHIKTQVYNDKTGAVKYTEKILKDRRLMIWTISNPNVLKEEERSTSSRYYSLHLMGQITHYFTKTGKISLVENAKDLHDWYKTHISKVLTEVPSDELKLVTDSIVKGKINEVDRVKAIYYWVQNNIKYIAFEEGMNGFIPRQPSSIFKKRYGDCKDMASLIYCMLKQANVPAYLTWIGTRDLPYKYSEFPSSICDNHMITTYMDQGKPMFLDATCSFLPYGFPSYGIIGKEAFVHFSESEYRILEVPTMKKEDSYWIDSSFISFENKKITGKCKGIAAGFYNIFINDVYKNCSKNKINEMVQDMNQKGNNTFKVIRSTVENIGDRDTSLNINYDFEINNYVSSYEKEVFINMVLEKDIAYGELKETRKAPFNMDNLSSNSYVVVLDVPNEYLIKSTPKDASFQSEFVDYKMSYKTESNKITMSITLDLKFLVLYPKSFNKWNEFVKIMKSSMLETVVLQKK